MNVFTKAALVILGCVALLDMGEAEGQCPGGICTVPAGAGAVAPLYGQAPMAGVQEIRSYAPGQAVPFFAEPAPLMWCPCVQSNYGVQLQIPTYAPTWPAPAYYSPSYYAPPAAPMYGQAPRVYRHVERRGAWR